MYIESIVGNLEDIVGSEILMAEEVNNTDHDEEPLNEKAISYTWTFYKIATIKGYVTIRWYGESNSCYSEKADIIRLK